MWRLDGSSATEVSKCEFELETGLSLASLRILLVVEDLYSVVWNWRLKCEVMINADDRMVSL